MRGGRLYGRTPGVESPVLGLGFRDLPFHGAFPVETDILSMGERITVDAGRREYLGRLFIILV